MEHYDTHIHTCYFNNDLKLSYIIVREPCMYSIHGSLLPSPSKHFDIRRTNNGTFHASLLLTIGCTSLKFTASFNPRKPWPADISAVNGSSFFHGILRFGSIQLSQGLFGLLLEHINNDLQRFWRSIHMSFHYSFFSELIKLRGTND